MALQVKYSESLTVQHLVRVQPSARSRITGKVKSVLDKLYPLLIEEARRTQVALTRIEVSTFSDPEDDTTELVVTQWVQLSPSSALEYWDRVGIALQHWSQQLSRELRRIALERIAVEVRWDEGSFPVP